MLTIDLTLSSEKNVVFPIEGTRQSKILILRRYRIRRQLYFYFAL